jgi:hypothetical protein
LFLTYTAETLIVLLFCIQPKLVGFEMASADVRMGSATTSVPKVTYSVSLPKKDLNLLLDNTNKSTVSVNEIGNYSFAYDMELHFRTNRQFDVNPGSLKHINVYLNHGQIYIDFEKNDVNIQLHYLDFIQLVELMKAYVSGNDRRTTFTRVWPSTTGFENNDPCTIRPILYSVNKLKNNSIAVGYAHRFEKSKTRWIVNTKKQ